MRSMVDSANFSPLRPLQTRLIVFGSTPLSLANSERFMFRSASNLLTRKAILSMSSMVSPLGREGRVDCTMTFAKGLDFRGKAAKIAA